MSGASPYDPEARRDTPLALKLKQRISRDGPITVAQYMDSCLNDPDHGYYCTKTAIGAKGDFVTAPEISQVFGELIGLWAAVVWQQMGKPARFNFVELGPGRGTMMADALRAARRVPGFLEAVRLLLVEPSKTLRAVQVEKLAQTGVASQFGDHRSLSDEAVRYPTILFANEVIDCLPVNQIERCVDAGGTPGWRQRVVGLDEAGQLAFGLGRTLALLPGTEHLLPEPKPGDIIEDRNNTNLLRYLTRAAPAGLVVGLFLDYGHARSGYGDTLQAVRDHAYEHLLTSPGEADLTAQVDFAAFAALVGRYNSSPEGSAIPFAVDGPITQGEFLGRLGIMERASRLMSANPGKAHEIEAGVARLMAVPGMGDRFKAIGIRSADLPPLPGF